jgi:hypothetical protein
MRQYKQCLKSVDVNYKTCVQCLAMQHDKFSWEPKSSLCYSTAEAMKGHTLTNAAKNCAQNQVCKTIEVKEQKPTSLTFTIQPSGMCIFKI